MTTLAATPQLGAPAGPNVAQRCLAEIAQLEVVGRLPATEVRDRILQLVARYQQPLDELRAKLRGERGPILELRRKRINLGETNQLLLKDITSQLDVVSLAVGQLAVLRGRLDSLGPMGLRQKYKTLIAAVTRLRDLPTEHLGNLIPRLESEARRINLALESESSETLERMADEPLDVLPEPKSTQRATKRAKD